MTESLPVLLHAAARGARLQMFDEDGGLWIDIYPWELGNLCDYHTKYRLDPMFDFRIHPKDHHLRYGPISHELRKRAESKEILVSSMAMGAWKEHLSTEEMFDYFLVDNNHQSIFLLLVAESLIEDGL